MLSGPSPKDLSVKNQLFPFFRLRAGGPRVSSPPFIFFACLLTWGSLRRESAVRGVGLRLLPLHDGPGPFF